MKILLHFPHTSLRLPKIFYKNLMIGEQLLNKYNLEMTDLQIDKLFGDIQGTRIKAKYSRLFCDVERFKDDQKETMFKYGEGKIYTRLYDGKEFHFNDEKYEQKVIKYYDKYHKKVDRITNKLLKKDDELLILDCHSFSNKMAKNFYEEPFPDACIGVDKDFYDEKILKNIISKVEKMGLTYKINYPYSGAFVPNALFNNQLYKSKKICAIMLEINKRIYL